MMPTNGLLNRLHWSLIETAVSPQYEDDPAPTAIFAAESDESTYASWPFHFQATYVVSLASAVHGLQLSNRRRLVPEAEVKINQDRAWVGAVRI
jgi:hypothetical protein